MRNEMELRPRDGPKQRRVHQFGPEDGAPIVLLHEVHGIGEPTTKLACDLGMAGYHVFVPELLPNWGNLNLVRICLSNQFTAFASGKSSRISEWVSDLCAEIADESGHTVAVIGMCATGGIVFSLLHRPHIGAVVGAQPSLPFRYNAATITQCELGCTSTEAVLAASSGKPVLVMRFEGDRLCPAGRASRLEELWRTQGDPDNLELIEFPGKGHSTITVHRVCADVKGKSSMEILLGWLASSVH